MPTPEAACAELVERGDPVRFAATMAAPPAARSSFWPLYALNLELARAPYAAREPMLAEMRLQWWVDEVGRIAAGAEGQGEVAQALAPVLRQTPGIAPLLADMADARRRDCARDTFADAGALWDYLDRTGGHLMWAAALTQGAPFAAEPVVRDLAAGAAMAGWLASVPALKAAGQSPLPDGSDAGVSALAREGLARLDRAEARRAEVPRAAGVALYPAWPARGLLTQVLAHPERVAEGLQGPGGFRQTLALGWRALTGRW